MARVTTVKKARKDQGRCHRAGCSTEIKRGDTYRWVSLKTGPRSSFRKVFCEAHPPRLSEKTTSGKLATLYQAQENVTDELAALDAESADVGDFETIRDDAMEAVRGVAEEYTESADNMADGFGHDTAMSDELREKGDEVEQWASTIEYVDFEEFDVDTAEGTFKEPEVPEEAEHAVYRANVIEEARKAHLATKRGEWFEEQVGKLEEAMGECPV